MSIYVSNSDTNSLIDMCAMCAQGSHYGVLTSVDVNGNRSENQTKSNKALGSL